MEDIKFVQVIVIYLIAYAIEPFLWFMAFMKFLKPRFEKKVLYVLCCIGLYGIILVKQWGILFSDSDSNSDLVISLFPIMLCYFFLVLKFFYLETKTRKIKIFVTGYLLSMVMDVLAVIVYSGLGFSTQEIMTFGMKSSVVNLCIALAKMLVFFSLKNFYEISIEKDGKFYMLIFYSMILISTFIAVVFFSEDLQNRRGALLSIYSIHACILFLTTIFTIMLFRNKSAKEKAARARAEMSESKLALYQYTKETYEEVKSIRHDIKRHYNYLRELAHQNKVHEIESYLDELCSDLKRTDDLYVCDNLVLSVALYDKGQTAKEQNITFSKSITANTFPFTDSELNSILTNILDNAFEAVEKVTEGERKVSFVVKKINEAELMIHCENTYNKEVYNNLSFLSTGKDDKVNHGYGTKIVKSIVKRYHGTVTYWKDDINFYVRVIVPST